jgi:hypothetical protein
MINKKKVYKDVTPINNMEKGGCFIDCISRDQLSFYNQISYNKLNKIVTIL